VQQNVPEINLIAQEEIVCHSCRQSVLFVLDTEDGKQLCKTCFKDVEPQYTAFIADFSDVLEMLHFLKESRMSLEDMYEIYGNGQLELDARNTETGEVSG